MKLAMNLKANAQNNHIQEIDYQKNLLNKHAKRRFLLILLAIVIVVAIIDGIAPYIKPALGHSLLNDEIQNASMMPELPVLQPKTPSISINNNIIQPQEEETTIEFTSEPVESEFSEPMETEVEAEEAETMLAEVNINNVENISVKTSTQLTENVKTTIETGWKIIAIKYGDNFVKIAYELHLTKAEIGDILANKETRNILSDIQAGKKFEVFLNAAGKAEKIHYPVNLYQTLEISYDGKNYHSTVVTKELVKTVQYQEIKVNGSLISSSNQAGLSQDIIQQFAKVFGHEVDINQLDDNDIVRIAYEAWQYENETVKEGNIVVAEVAHQGNTYQSFRYTLANGKTSYYNADGREIQKTFFKVPLKYTRVSSHFNPKRLHPISKKVKPHLGTDFAAPTGTKIYAPADGKITYLGRRGGYGKFIMIQHGEHYETRYAHLSKYATGLKYGSKVKQGQLIGYVGTTGYSTGPHLHYEIRVDGKAKNPLSITSIITYIPDQEKNKFKAEVATQLTYLRKDQPIQLAKQ